MKRLVLLLPLLVISQTHAETLAQFEKKLIQKYANKDFYQVNQAIESEIVEKIEHDPASFKYSFPALQDHYHMHIQFSPDQQLKFYTFDVGGGGTMGEYSSYVQTQNEGKMRLTAVETGFIFIWLRAIIKVAVVSVPMRLLHFSRLKRERCGQ